MLGMTTESSEIPRLMNTDEVAGLARVVSKTVLRAVARGDLLAVRLGRNTLRFDPSDVRSWVESQKGKAVRL